MKKKTKRTVLNTVLYILEGFFLICAFLLPIDAAYAIVFTLFAIYSRMNHK